MASYPGADLNRVASSAFEDCEDATEHWDRWPYFNKVEEATSHYSGAELHMVTSRAFEDCEEATEHWDRWLCLN